MQKTLLQTIRGPVIFLKTAALTPAHIASVFVGLDVGKFISKLFFPPAPLSSVSCGDFVAFVCACPCVCARARAAPS